VHTILKFCWLSPAALFFIVSSCGSEKQKAVNQGVQLTSVEAFVTKSQSVENIFRTPGNLIPAEVIEIRPEISGRVISLNFIEGTSVKKDQVLVQIDDSELQAELKKFNAQLRIAFENEQRKKELLAIKGISQEEYDQALSELEVLQASVDLTKTQIRKSKIVAPFNGRIGLRYISEGAFIQSGTIIATLAQTDMLKIEFSVPEKYAGFIRNGLTIQFIVDGKSSYYTADVYAYEPVIDEASRTLKIRAKTNNKENQLIPGSFAEVTLNFERFENAIMVPTQAIIPALNSQNVFLYRNGRMKFTKVTTGIQTDKMIQITDGLGAEDTVAMTAILALKDNMPVVISKIVEE
jgi:membrane fusion protein (multidrug efflux system)